MSWPALPFDAWRATRDTLHAAHAGARQACGGARSARAAASACGSAVEYARLGDDAAAGARWLGRTRTRGRARSARPADRLYEREPPPLPALHPKKLDSAMRKPA